MGVVPQQLRKRILRGGKGRPRKDQIHVSAGHRNTTTEVKEIIQTAGKTCPEE